MLLYHADHPADSLVLVVNDSAFLIPGHQASVRHIGPVREYLPGRGKTDVFRCPDALTPVEAEKDQRRVKGLYSFGDRKSKRIVLAGHVVECAVRFDMADADTGGLCKSMERSELVGDVCSRLCRGYVQVSPAKAHQVRISRMCADPDPGIARHCHCFLHDQRIGGVVSAGDVAGGDQRDHLFIHSDSISAEAFSQITVQINLYHIFFSFSFLVPFPAVPRSTQSFRSTFFTSSSSICPGAWVIAKSGLTFMTTDWGVTPQGQNMVTSPS